jgi:asparagine synthase (glutamine-hydrolysing)
MCGISGIIALNEIKLSNQDLQDLDIMLNSMFHRGPDGQGKKMFPNSYFGMRRLAIIDFEGGQQPISNEADDIWVVMNGEIYNYIELRFELIKLGHKFKTNSDTEVIVHLYEEFGKDFIKKINGMFAIYLLDQRNNIQFLFRDHIGIKPLFYGFKNGRFMFSSDLKGLASIMKAQLSRDSLLSYIGLSYIPKPSSIYEGIYKMMPGTAILFSGNQEPVFYSYWELSANNRIDVSYNEAVSHLSKLMIDSNSIQLRSDADFAISLSGGLDSSSVLAFASLASNKSFNTISMGYDEKNDSMDLKFAEMIAKRYNTNHISINLQSNHFFDYIDEIMPLIDEPIADSALIPNYILSKEASKRGIKVLLSGAGGDELFGGYGRHFIPSVSSARGLFRYPKALRLPGYLLLNLLHPFSNNERLKYPNLAFASAINGLNYTFLAKCVSPQNYNLLLKVILEHYKDISDVQNLYSQSRMLNDTKNYLVDNILSLSDKSSMAASIEGRFPLIDYRIVEFAFSLPTNYTIHNGIPKGILKDIAGQYIPNEILNRKKEGYNAPMQKWFGNNKLKEIRDYVQNGIQDRLSDIIDPIAFKQIFTNKETADKSFENIYNLYFLLKWMEYNER